MINTIDQKNGIKIYENKDINKLAMELFEKHPISFEGENFEIRVLDGDQSVNVVFFRNNHLANCFKHQLKRPKDFDLKR